MWGRWGVNAAARLPGSFFLSHHFLSFTQVGKVTATAAKAATELRANPCAELLI